MLALDGELEFDPAREEEFFAALPARPAVFLVEPRQAGAAPYLLRTADLRRRKERLLRAPEMPSQRLNVREFAARVRYRLTGSRFEQSLLFYQHARERFPRRYQALVRLRPPALLKVNLANEYPRCYITRRILSDGGFYFGPFASRKAAEAFANDFLDLFKLRRCQIKIRRDPSFPGCIYSEMKMCLAPCFAGCTKPEYDVEVGRVLGFLASSGTTLAREFEREREAASEALHFERAAALHRKLEKVAEILRGLAELARKVDELDAVVLQPAAEGNTIALFAVRGGRIADPFFLRFDELASQPRSVEEILRESLKPPMDTDEHRLISGDDGPLRQSVAPDSGSRAALVELAEHLGLLARWFYSKPRKGEIFFRPRAGGAKEPAAADWPYRRIIRACSRLLAPTEPPSNQASS
jgi:excinuclease UvrABC nuclease subunit